MNKALSEHAWENMQKHGRLVEYYDYVRDVIMNDVDLTIQQKTLLYLYGICKHRKDRPTDQSYVLQLTMDLPTEEEIEIVRAHRRSECELHPEMFKGKKNITEYFLSIKTALKETDDLIPQQ